MSNGISKTCPHGWSYECLRCYRDPGRQSNEELLWDSIKVMPPIVRAAIQAIIDFEQKRSQNEMGYDLSYFQEDLPNAVRKAIEPWQRYDDGS